MHKYYWLIHSSQQGDQASIVGGAIDFVKELEQLLQSLETQKRRLQEVTNKDSRRPTTADGGRSPPFSQFFTYPQYTWCQAPRENQTIEKHNQLHPATTTSMADIEVTIIEKHTNLRILTHKRPGHLLKLVSGLEALHLAILHINATTLDPMALYSISAKVCSTYCNYHYTYIIQYMYVYLLLYTYVIYVCLIT